MKKLTATALMTVMLAVAPAVSHAADASDVNAIHKDNTALRHDATDLEKDRIDKANAKATGDTAKQAGTSMAIGADHVITGEKKAEKNIDEKIANHDSK